MKAIIPSITTKKAMSVIEACEGHGLEIQYDKTARENNSVTFRLSEPKQGCACSMLSDNADWNSAIWDLQPTVLQSLSSTIAAIGRCCQKGFTFTAEWVSEPPNKKTEITLSELITLVRSNKVGTRTKYVVS